MAKHTFIINDESVNQLGFRVLTSGISLSRFSKNPVVKVMHRRYDEWMPIGKATNLRVEGAQLLGDVEFDQADELAVKIEKKVEGGYLNATSMGLEPIEWSEDPLLMVAAQTYPTLSKSELMEISIVDIPNNANTVRLMSGEELVLLSAKNMDAFVPKIKSVTQTQTKMNLKAIFMSLIGLQIEGASIVNLSAKNADEPTEGEVMSAIAMVAQRLQAVSAEAATAKSEVVNLTAQIEQATKAALAEKAANLVTLAVQAGKITKDQEPAFLALASANYDSTKTVLDGMKAHQSIVGQLNQGGGEDQLLTLSWDEAHKTGKLETIKSKYPEHFESLKSGKFGK
jgi:hypothetical protein